MKKFSHFLIFFLLFFVCQNSYSKPIPPGSGAGDVPANILFLLDSSASMKADITDEQAQLGVIRDIVELADGNLIVATSTFGIVKVNPDDGIKDPTFGGVPNGEYRGSSLANCNGKISTINSAHRLEISNNVAGITGEVIFAFQNQQNRIVMIDSSGNCIDVIDTSDPGWRTGFKTRQSDIRTINGEDHLFVVLDKAASGSNRWGAIYTKNLATGTSRDCYVGPGDTSPTSFGNNLRLRLGRSDSITVDNGNNVYIARNGHIFRYSLQLNGDNYCPDPAATSGYKQYSYTTAPDCVVSDRHCKALEIQIDPGDDSIMYSTTNNLGVIQKLKITDTNLIPELTDKIKGMNSRDASFSDSKVYFFRPSRLHITSSNVWVVDLKPSIQIFKKDTNLTWVSNFGSTTRRIDGAVSAIKSILSDSSFTSSANFGYGHWNSGVTDNPDRCTSGSGCYPDGGQYCHDNNCTYYNGWDGSHPDGQSSLCNVSSCLLFGIHQESYAKIIDYFNNEGQPLAWGTDALAFAQMADKYFFDPAVNVIDPTASDCQINHVIVISDGVWKHHSAAVTQIQALRAKNVKTIAVGYGEGIRPGDYSNFEDISRVGTCSGGPGSKDCKKAIFAKTPADLKEKLTGIVQQIIADRLSFTAPSITATIQEGGSLYQAQFNYEQYGEWQGTILRKTLKADGSVDHDMSNPSNGNWDAAEKVKNQAFRKIWTVLPDANYIGEWNNFKTDNSTYINNLFTLTGYEVPDYHNSTSTCAGVGIDGNDDDIDGLINFVRGTDYFGYEGCGNIANKKEHILGDIYNSQLIEVGAPSANTNFSNGNEESFWRSKHNYQSFARTFENRKSILYAGANDGMLHAFNAETGEEEWAFVPPFIAAKLPTIVNPNLDGKVDGNGGTNAIFGVDGSPVVHDMYIKGLDINGNKELSRRWHTILMIPYGRGGAGFSVLDITHTLVEGSQGPLHMFSIFNDIDNSKVLVADKDGVISSYPYISTSYQLGQSKEARKANKNEKNTSDPDSIYTCQSNADVVGNFYQNGSNSCYKGNTFTFNFTAPTTNINKYQIIKTNADGTKTTTAPVSITAIGGLTEITFSNPEVYNASESTLSVEKTSKISISLTEDMTGVLDHDYKYDYSQLGETWSTPRIFRMPINPDGEYSEDKYVAVMGGGYGSSKIFIINFEDENFPGSIVGSKENRGPISIIDTDSSDISNALIASPVVITPDNVQGISWRGAMVYTNDLEGKITKINLSNSKKNGASLYEKTTLFKLNSTSSNSRYSYFSLDASIGKDSKAFWLFGGTGNFQRVNDVEGGSDNILYGIKDHDFPYFKSSITIPREDTDGWKTLAVQNVNAAHDVDDPNICIDTTSDATGDLCPKPSEDGWVFHLDNLTNNKYRKLTGTPRVFKGRVYFPIYKPPDGGNRCALGTAYICSADDECGTNKSAELYDAEETTPDADPCYRVREGILSELVVFGDTLYGNVAGPSDTEDTLVSVLAGSGEISTFRKSWRQNY